jgi:transposase
MRSKCTIYRINNNNIFGMNNGGNHYFPEIVDKTESEINKIFDAINSDRPLPDAFKPILTRALKLAIWLPSWLEKKNISLRRLRTMVFGKGYGRGTKSNSAPPKNGAGTTSSHDPSSPPLTTEPHSNIPAPITPSNSEETVDSTMDSATRPKEKAPGHGRLPHTAYHDCEEIHLVLEKLSIGGECPLCGGKLGPYDAGIIIRVRGQNFAKLLRYTVDKLRCNLCNEIFTVELPPEVGEEKYDPAFIAMLAIMKYYVAIPFYRQEQFQKLLNFPLSDSTQWDLIEKLSGYCYAAFNELKRLAANGKLIQNDDTRLKILEVIKQIKAGTAGERTGMYTTGIVAEHDGHPIALFLNGQQHSGENVAALLKHRNSELPPIIQMCDALSANIPKALQTILCNCLSHGFRKFSELVDYFPEECLAIMHKLSIVYEYDAYTKEHKMNAEQRLVYHQEHSAPVMEVLAMQMAALLKERRVEPNSELGKAIKYMRKHWKKLTRFLSVAGAPIDNNIVERALKVAIRNRKASLFYRTNYSAHIGGMFTSLMYTCHLGNVNPQHYLIALQQYQAAVTAAPQDWLPWNYQSAMAKAQEANVANQQAHAPPRDYLAAA